MMSWHYEKLRDGKVDVAAFFLRRFFRIAPAYYLASILYFFLAPPVNGFSPIQAAAAFLFINAWHPTLLGLTPGSWTVVPGGWSIGVEFTFYAVFPVLAYTITSLPRAVCLFLTTLAAGAALNSWYWLYLEPTSGAVPADNFLYFWFPNQMSVFALGLSLFYLLKRDGVGVRYDLLRAYPNRIAALAVVAFATRSFVSTPHWLNLSMPVPPRFIFVSLSFTIFILALSRAANGVWVNRPIAMMGRVSFSAYLLHFALLQIISQLPFLQNYLNGTGWYAILGFAMLLICLVPIVQVLSWCSYTVIETPMIDVGKVLIRQRALTARRQSTS